MSSSIVYPDNKDVRPLSTKTPWIQVNDNEVRIGGEANYVQITKTGALTLVGSASLKAKQIDDGTDPVNAVASAAKLTLTGVITPGNHALSILTSDTTNVTAADTVTIGSTVYRFMDTMAAVFDVQIGASAAATLDNLKAAINLTGTEGTEYFAGLTAHPTVYATTNTDTAQTIIARVPGVTANAIATTELSTHLSWADTTLGGGTGASVTGVASESVTIGSTTYSFVDALSETSGADAIANQVLFGASSAEALDNLKLAINHGSTEGTEYSTGTVVDPLVSAGTNSNTEQTVTAKISGVSGDLIAVTSSLANGAWDDVTLGTAVAGVDGTVGLLGEVRYNATTFFLCSAVNTIADANWVSATLATY